MDNARADASSFREILFRVEPVTPGSSSMENAISFAKQQGARLWGVYALEYLQLPGYIEAQLPKELLDKNRGFFDKQAKETESAFRDACISAELDWAWRCVEADPAQAVIASGRLADLTLIGRSENERESPTGEYFSRVVLEGGRPVLVMPNDAIVETTASRIVLAWNGRREAVRATYDALPLLRGAQWVKVVVINSHEQTSDYGEHPGSELCRHLSRHGVNAEAREISVRGQSEGAALLDLAMEENADLIVMGAYGHSRWREIVIGGVTAHVLRHATLPVFMSH